MISHNTNAICVTYFLFLSSVSWYGLLSFFASARGLLVANMKDHNYPAANGWEFKVLPTVKAWWLLLLKKRTGQSHLIDVVCMVRKAGSGRAIGRAKAEGVAGI
jgi:hypothetical protein